MLQHAAEAAPVSEAPGHGRDRCDVADSIANQLVVALDIDETITRHPSFFAFLSHALTAAGHRVLVITFRIDRAAAEADLRSWGIAYDDLFTPSVDPDSDDGTDEWKGRLCEEHRVDVLFDDSPEVLRFVGPGVLSLMVVDQARYDLSRLCKRV